MNEASHLIVQTTVASEAQAQHMAQLAIHQGLAACVHIEPIQSLYRWQGQIEHDAEWRLGFKTLPHLATPLVAALRAVHPYELPAFYAVPAAPLTPEWSQWVKQQLSAQA